MARRDGYVILPVTAFPGLNLRQQPIVGALDLRNVAFPDVGGVRNRSGSARFGAVDHGARVRALQRFHSVNGTRRLIVCTDTALRALDESGALVHTAAGAALPTGPMRSFARVGVRGGERLYLANAKDTVRRYDLAGGFSAPTATTIGAVNDVETAGVAMPRAGCVAHWAAEGRTVYAGFDLFSAGPGGLESNHDIAWISEPDRPEAFRDDSWITLSAGDGARTVAIVSWRDQCVVFKEDKHFTLSSVLVSGSNVIFQRRGNDTQVGPCGPRAVSVGRDAIYFVGRKGLYATTGIEPVLLSYDLNALWGEAPMPPFYTGGRIDPNHLADIQVQCVGDLVFVAYQSEGGADQDRLLVYHTIQKAFTLYELPCTCLGVFRSGAIDELYFGHPAVNVVMRHAAGIKGDDGHPYRSFWLGGFEEMAGGRVVRVRQSALYGSGWVDYGLAGDFRQVHYLDRVNMSAGTDLWGDGTDPADLWGDGTDPDDLWGDGGAVAGKLTRRAYRAAYCAVYLGDNPNSIAEQQDWFVHRVNKHIAGGRAVSVVAGEDH